ncbi:helix-turn-helix domain-containing protein [Methanolapillus ohkumae]|uniref:HTH marR-type domain-containing protein n=1 Tax=Methanolapillus ohkumae TaxID=3028298 RepID=A0AA97A5Y8_9EURY|nr:hypothetical protein MsAm2_06230 [Methanosarcinaceae archaeon Am2]
MTPEEEIILNHMKHIGKPVKQSEIEEISGMDKKEVTKIINSLKKQGLVCSPQRCYYAPEE